MPQINKNNREQKLYPASHKILYLVKVSAALTFTLGMLVIFGWHLNLTTLVQLHPSFVPMQYNTALGFLFSGGSLILLVSNRKKYTALASYLLLFLGCATLSQYAFHWDLGIDELLMQHPITTKTSHPGRMAPNTALCFSLVACICLVHARLARPKLKWLLLHVLTAVLLTLSLIALVGYISQVETAYGWGNLTRMALHTAIGFIVIGLGCFSLNLSLPKQAIPQINLWIAGAAATGVLLFMLAVWQQTITQQHLLIQRTLSEEVHFMENHLQSMLMADIKAVERMGTRWQRDKGTPYEQWQIDARQYITDYPSMRALEWVDINSYVRWIEPLAGNEKAQDLNLLFEPKRAKALLQAQNTKQITFTAPIDLVQGGKGLLAFVPLQIESQFSGFLLVVFDIARLLEEILPTSIITNYGMSLMVENENVFTSSNAEQSYLDQWAYNRELHLYGINWQIHVWPKKSLMMGFSSVTDTLFTGSFIISLLMGSSIYLFLTVRQRNRALNDSEQQQRAILESNIDGIISIDQQGIVQSYNSACEKLFAYPANEVIGQNIKMLMPPPFHQEHDGYLSAYKHTGEKKVIGIGRQVKGQRKDGSIFPMELGVSEFYASGQKFFTGVVRDITERVKHEEERESLINALTRSNEELDNFAYIASHDLKEPLRAIYNHSAFLLEDYEAKLDEAGVHKLNRLMYLTKRMQQLISDLFYFSRLGREQLAISNTDISLVLHDIQNTMEDMLLENKAHILLKAPLPTQACDKVKVTELFRNLITNGIKYNDKEPKVIEVGVLATKQDEKPIFYVKDNGIGIDAKFHQDIFRIFKRLNSVKKYGEGTGAGLTFAKKIIQQHGGHIWLESELGVGSTFFFTL